jgi:hypothetical protein
MKIKPYILSLLAIISLLYACTSKEDRYKKKVQEYYDAYYQKRDMNSIKSLFSAGIQYYDDKYKMPADTFALIFDFDKKLQAKTQIVNMTVNKDTVTVIEKLTDELDPLLKRPSAQYKKKFILKDNKILQIISLPYKQEEWAKMYVERMQQFFIWMRETNPKEFLILVSEPYTHADLILTHAKEYAKQVK